MPASHPLLAGRVVHDRRSKRMVGKHYIVDIAQLSALNPKAHVHVRISPA